MSDTLVKDDRFFEERLSKFALNVAASCRMDSQYNPEKDILTFMDNNVQDVLIVTGTDDKHYPVHVYCNGDYPLIGRIMQMDLTLPFDNELQMKKINRDYIGGDASIWKSKFNKDPRQFFEEFMIENTKDAFVEAFEENHDNIVVSSF